MKRHSPGRTTYHLSLDEIRVFASEFAQTLKGGEVLALIGPLGAGKTTFAQALSLALGIKRRVTSPTFVMMQEFHGKLPANNKAINLYHLDIYRADHFKEVSTLGVEEFWGKTNTITLIEWADKIQKHLPKQTIFIHFDS